MNQLVKQSCEGRTLSNSVKLVAAKENVQYCVFSVPYSCIFIVFVFMVGSGISIYPQSRDALILEKKMKQEKICIFDDKVEKKTQCKIRKGLPVQLCVIMWREEAGSNSSVFVLRPHDTVNPENTNQTK